MCPGETSLHKAPTWECVLVPGGYPRVEGAQTLSPWGDAAPLENVPMLAIKSLAHAPILKSHLLLSLGPLFSHLHNGGLKSRHQKSPVVWSYALILCFYFVYLLLFGFV